MNETCQIKACQRHWDDICDGKLNPKDKEVWKRARYDRDIRYYIDSPCRDRGLRQQQTAQVVFSGLGGIKQPIFAYPRSGANLEPCGAGWDIPYIGG